LQRFQCGGWLSNADNGPNVTAIRHVGGDVHLRCYVELIDVYRTNAHVTWWHKDNAKPMPLIRATALSATVKSPGCKTAKRRRRKAGVTGNGTKSDGKYQCSARWDRPRPYIPATVQRNFLTLETSRHKPTLELCVETDPCAKSESIIY